MDAKNTYRRAAQWLLGAGVVLAMAGCSNPTTETALNSATETSPPAKNLFAIGTVIESDRSGPQLCGAVMTSMPPGCAGVPIANWNWDKIPTKNSLSGTTWSSGYVLIGTLAQGEFTLTQDPILEEDYTGPRPTSPEGKQLPQDPPCSAPKGAWAKQNFPDWDPKSFYKKYPDIGSSGRNPNSPRESEIHREKGLPHVVSAWSSPLDPETGAILPEVPEGTYYGVLSVSVTGDVAQARETLATIYKGPLCVVSSTVSRDQLHDTPDEIHRLLTSDPALANFTMVSMGVHHAHVELDVSYDDGTVQKTMDEKFGDGLVFVRSALFQPLPKK